MLVWADIFCMTMLERALDPPFVVVEVIDKATSSSLGKKTTRHWDAWTHEEEENFFFALRHVGKNFDEITRRVQSKNKDQVRHYYYRLIKRINKLLGPGFVLDAKNAKDTNSAMLRWWLLMEKQSCSASKLHLKPRRFKTFVTALENQLTKDRKKANKKKNIDNQHGISEKPSAGVIMSLGYADTNGKAVLEQSTLSVKRKTKRVKSTSQEGLLQPSRQRKRPSAAFRRKWEKAASEGVNLVAEAAEQLERAAAGELLAAGAVLVSVKENLKAPVIQSSCGGMELTQPDLTSALLTLPLASDNKDATQPGDGENQMAAKLKLQLFPIDDMTRKSMEEAGLNPYLELTLKPRKPVSSVLRHLTQKWGRTSSVKGQLQLFPYDVVKGYSASCQMWNSDDTVITAGDVHAALGRPFVFRLRYGWMPSRILEISQAEALEEPAIARGCLRCETAPHIVNFDPVKSILPGPLEYQQTTTSRKNCEDQAGTFPRSPSIMMKEAVTSTQCSSGLARIDANSTVNIASPNSTGTSTGYSKDKHKEQEAGGCSWLCEGSNDGFSLRLWAAEDPVHCDSTMLPQIDWADCLTNMSVGELLNEVSQAGKMAPVEDQAPTHEGLQGLQSLDSFDTALAAHHQGHAHASTNVTTSFHVAGTTSSACWDGEDTRDAFGFHKVVAQRAHASSVAPMLSNCQSLELPSAGEEPLRNSGDALALSLMSDCGSLEAWKQSFSHVELTYPEELNGDPNSLFGKRCLSQDSFWVS